MDCFSRYEKVDLMKIKFAKGKTKFIAGIDSPAQMESWLKENPTIVGLVVAGRSNVGKSSLINSLFGKSVARISKTPGRTRQINIFTFEFEYEDQENETVPCPLYLFDLPGYGHAKVSKEMGKNWNVLMSTFFNNIDVNNVCLLNIQDARHPDQKADADFANFIYPFNFETFLLFNKMDKLKTQKDRGKLKKLEPGIFKKYSWVKQIYHVSAEKGTGLDQLSTGSISFLLGRVKNL